MALPAFDSAAPAVSAASNAGLTLPVYPSGDPTGLLLIAFVASFAVGGAPVAPAGWSGPRGRDGLWAFHKVGVLADSGTSVTFAAWTPEVISTENSGVVVAFASAANWDLVAPAISKRLSGSGTFFSAAFPTGRTTVANTVPLAVCSFQMTPPFSASLAIDSLSGTADVDRVNYTPTLDKAWLGVSSLNQAAAGAAVLRKAVTTTPGNMRLALYALRDNQPPTAPNLGSPASGATLDVTAAQVFSWTFTDPDPMDTESKFDLVCTNVTAGGSTTITQSTAETSWTIPAGTFIAGDSYTWKVRTYDSDGNVSAYSATNSFTATSPPAAPGIIAPTAGATITTPVATLNWASAPLDQTTYQIRRVADAGGIANPAVVYWDSGEIGTSSDTSVGITFDTTGRDEHVQIRTRGTSGLWGPWADVLVHIAFIPPPTPTVTLTAFPAGAQIQVTVATPAPSGSEPAATSVDILLSTDAGATWIRVATGLAINTEWSYLAPASGQEYWFAAVAIADDSASATSDWVDIASIDPGDFDSTSDIIDGGSW